MKPIFVHFYEEGKAHVIKNKKVFFERIPYENEYVAFSVESPLYRVKKVVHTPFSEEMCAEIDVVLE